MSWWRDLLDGAMKGAGLDGAPTTRGALLRAAALGGVMAVIVVAGIYGGLQRAAEAVGGLATRAYAHAAAAASGRPVTDFTDTPPGFLYIENPQLYTRERLVNDRFRQANWLNAMLEASETPEFAARLAAPSRSERNIDRLLAAMGAEAEGATPEAAAAAAAAEALRLDETDAFERLSAYRMLLRNELMDTQLDDGHDLDGNTLYRLNFDVVAMPWADLRRDPGSAVFVIEASRPGVEHVADQRQQLDDDRELLEAWQRETQIFLNRVIEQRVEAFLQNAELETRSDPKEDIAFDWYLRVSLVEAFLDLLADGMRVAPCPGTLEAEARAACEAAFERWETGGRDERKTMAAEWLRLGYRPGAPSPEIADLGMLAGLRNAVRAASEVNNHLNQHGCEARAGLWPPTDGAEPSRRCAAEYIVRDPNDQLAMMRLITAQQALSTRLLTGDPDDLRLLDAGVLRPRAGAPTPEKLGLVMRTLGAMLPRTEEVVDVEAWRATVTDLGASGPDLEALAFGGGRPCNPHVPPTAYGRCIFLTSRVSETIQKQITQFVHRRLTEQLPAYDPADRAIDDFLDVRVAGCELGGCRIEVRGRYTLNPREKEALDEPLSEAPQAGEQDARACARAVLASIPEGDAAARLADPVGEFADEPARVQDLSGCLLRRWLDGRRNDLAVYSVSPRLDGAVVRSERLSQTLLAAGARSADVALSSEQAEAMAELRAAETVVGFSQIAVDEGGRAELANPKDEAVFGWVLRPRKAVSGGWSPAYHRLSTVLSVPSWWKRMDFSVTACWVSPQRARQIGARLATAPSLICGDPDARQQLRRVFRVQLPRRAEDVTARFNFDFIKAPYFEAEWSKSLRSYKGVALEVGRPGRLVLAGERLWRGTVVTVNGQYADSIVVLPDMKGVIAEFNCVEPPPGQLHLIDPFAAPPESLATARQAVGDEQEGKGRSDVQRNGDADPQTDDPQTGGPVNADPQNGGEGEGSQGRDASQNALPRPVAPQGGGQGPNGRALAHVWTSEGRTTPLEVTLLPFVRRHPQEKPCFLEPSTP